MTVKERILFPLWTFLRSQKGGYNSVEISIYSSSLQGFSNQLCARPLTHWFPSRAFHLMLPGKQVSINQEEDAGASASLPCLSMQTHTHWAPSCPGQWCVILFPPTAPTSWKKSSLSNFLRTIQGDYAASRTTKSFSVCGHLFKLTLRKSSRHNVYAWCKRMKFWEIEEKKPPTHTH